MSTLFPLAAARSVLSVGPSSGEAGTVLPMAGAALAGTGVVTMAVSSRF